MPNSGASGARDSSVFNPFGNLPALYNGYPTALVFLCSLVKDVSTNSGDRKAN